MKLTVILIAISAFHVTANTFAQHVTIKKKNAPLTEIFKEIRKQSGYDFLYSDRLIQNAKPVDIHLSNSNIQDVLQKVFENQSLSYHIEGTTIVLKAKPMAQVTPQNKIVNQEIKINGTVTDQSGTALIGVTVSALKSRVHVITDSQGRFTISLTRNNDSLRFSSVGYKPKVAVVSNQNKLNVILESLDNKVQDVVVTGIYSRPKDSFTGSATTYSADDLKAVGNLNIIQSLKTLDPVFAVLENNQFGSDPNKLPDLEIRGKSSIVGLKEQFEVDPNQPLFILDGFQTSLRTIVDLDMERVASVTILKDAASTAIYGSKAANGVVVVETKQPLPGQLRLSYTSNFNVSTPDFSSYNLMNAEEKLQFELLAGRYTVNNWDATNNSWDLYNKRLQNVVNGVDTYWLSDPVRTGINQRQSLYVEGGDAAMRYGVGANYNGNNGVMKNSNRTTFSGNIDLIYRKNKFLFSNKLTIDRTNTKDPLVAFSEYSRANPYYPKYDNEGFAYKWFENNNVDKASNPLWNASLNSRTQSKMTGIINNFSAEYMATNSLRIRTRLGVNKSSQENDQFISPQNTRFDTLDPLLRGSITYGNTQRTNIDGEFTATYGIVLNQSHRINAVAGATAQSAEGLDNGYTAQGFPNGDYVTAAFARGFPENGRPRYAESKSRSTSIYLNGGYSFADRYLMDVSYRQSGSSVFGSNRRFANTWSTGLAWNLHNESFTKELAPWINLLKLRGSIGNPGNQNFDAGQVYTTYGFSNLPTSYFGPGVSLSTLGNENLKWQTTIDKNVGLDAAFWQKRLAFNLDYFNKETDPLLISIGVPSSLGVKTVLTNLGLQQSSGFNGMITFSPIYRPADQIIWSLRFNFRTEKSKLDKIGNTLQKFNEGGRNTSTVRYFDGANPDAIWTVRSAGIDPASGQEIFIKKDGTYTLTYDYEDEVQIGIARPKIQGVFGSSITYKGFSANFDFRYRYGGEAFNSALFNKVENISAGNLILNQDKRALYDRWKKPGDISEFKGISLTDKSLMSSRFVKADNSIALESLRIGYDFRSDWLQRTGIKRLRFNAYMNDLFVISTMKAERGIDYPFARTVSFSASISL